MKRFEWFPWTRIFMWTAFTVKYGSTFVEFIFLLLVAQICIIIVISV